MVVFVNDLFPLAVLWGGFGPLWGVTQLPQDVTQLPVATGWCQVVEDACVVGFQKSNLVLSSTKFDFGTFWRASCQRTAASRPFQTLPMSQGGPSRAGLESRLGQALARGRDSFWRGSELSSTVPRRPKFAQRPFQTLPMSHGRAFQGWPGASSGPSLGQGETG